MSIQDRRAGSERRAADRRRSPQPTPQGAYGEMNAAKRQEALVRDNLKLVNFTVARLAIGLPSWVDRRDLVSAGVIGLIDAAKHFNPQKGASFETYASLRIRGAILDELRSMDWIPRSTREKSRQVEHAIADLTNRLGRFPTDDETATLLGWDADKYAKALDQISGTTLLSLDEVITSSSGDTVTRIDTVSGRNEHPLHAIEKEELLDKLVNVIGALAEQERLVIALYYYEELTLKEIGMVIKVTESRVSQIHTAAILKIRSKMKFYTG